MCLFKQGTPCQALESRLRRASWTVLLFLKIANESAIWKDGHYDMMLSFCDESLFMPDNKAVVELWAITLDRKLLKNKALYSDYTKFLNAMLKKGHDEKVPDDELSRCDGRVWYLPHHGVYHKKKHKIHVVFDFSYCKDLIWRTSSWASPSGMFHQVRIPKNYVDLLCFLWWPNGDLNKALTEYGIVTFCCCLLANLCQLCLKNNCQNIKG